MTMRRLSCCSRLRTRYKALQQLRMSGTIISPNVKDSNTIPSVPTSLALLLSSGALMYLRTVFDNDLVSNRSSSLISSVTSFTTASSSTSRRAPLQRHKHALEEVSLILLAFLNKLARIASVGVTSAFNVVDVPGNSNKISFWIEVVDIYSGICVITELLVRIVSAVVTSTFKVVGIIFNSEEIPGCTGLVDMCGWNWDIVREVVNVWYSVSDNGVVAYVVVEGVTSGRDTVAESIVCLEGNSVRPNPELGVIKVFVESAARKLVTRLTDVSNEVSGRTKHYTSGNF